MKAGKTEACSEEKEGLAVELLKTNPQFLYFCERMRATGKTFEKKNRLKNELSVIAFEGDAESDVSEGGEWLNLCLREYLERNRRFASRFKSMNRLILVVVTVVVAVFITLSVVWPVWDFLIDMEAERYYKVLDISVSASPAEIKKAYREKMTQWHPDRNPGCGDTCRQHVVSIQEAHDVLLSRGDRRFELANRYRDELLQIRSLVYFRIFNIAVTAAVGVELLVASTFRKCFTTSRSKIVLEVACKAATVGFFTLYEIALVSGFQFIIVAQLFYFGLSILKSSAQRVAEENRRKTAYVDSLFETLAFVVPAILYHVCRVVASSTNAFDFSELLRMVFGFLYLMSFLARFTPNIRDNFSLKKYSLPLCYVDLGAERFSRLNFILSECGLVVDDLFVFTCEVPSCYRIAVLLVHTASLTQMFSLPWDMPIRSRKAKKSAERTAERATDVEGRSEVSREASLRPEVVVSDITEDEEQLLTGLDGESVSWLDLPFVKYNFLRRVLTIDYTKRFKKEVAFSDIAANSDLRNVMIAVVYKEGDQQKLNILAQIEDPVMCRFVAIDTGTRKLLPDAQQPQLSYSELVGPYVRSTLSTLWHRKLPDSHAAQTMTAASWARTGVLCVCCGLLAGLCVAFSPSLLSVMQSTRELPPTLRPLLYGRYSPLIPAANPFNGLCAGLVTVVNGSFVLLSSDPWG